MNKSQVESAIKYQTVVELNDNTVMRGTRVTIKRQSRKTGNLTCVLVEDAADGCAYKKGNEVHVMPFCVQVITTRPDEAAKEYEAAHERILGRLRRMVQDSLDERKKIAQRIASGEAGALVNEMSWGHGVQQDLRASFAARILIVVTEGRATLEQALANVLENQEQCLLRNIDSGGSSNEYANAVAADKRDVSKQIVEFCRMELSELRDARAMMEVL